MMISRIKLLAATIMIVLSGSFVLMPAVSLADVLNGDACGGLNALQSGGNTTDNTTCDTKGQSQLSSIISFVVKTLSWILGIAAVIMVIVGGFKYITSAGDSSKAGSARHTIVYALIGLVVAILAQVIVHFVINSTTTATTPCSSSQANITKTDPTCKTPG